MTNLECPGFTQKPCAGCTHFLQNSKENDSTEKITDIIFIFFVETRLRSHSRLLWSGKALVALNHLLGYNAQPGGDISKSYTLLKGVLEFIIIF